MGKNNKNKESPNKSMKGEKKMDTEVSTVSSKRGRGNSGDDSPPELCKKPNKIPMNIAYRNDSSERDTVGDCDKGINSNRSSPSKGSGLNRDKENDSLRSKTVKEQLENRYNDRSLPPFVAFIDGIEYNPEQPNVNIGNMHPMELSDYICKNFADKDILKFKRLGKSIISIYFKSFAAANRFVDNSNKLPVGWYSYIPNYKIFRAAVVRGVNPNFSNEKILEMISWPGDSIKIKSIERLKYRANGSGDLRISSSIKLVLETDLLSEYIYVAKWKLRVKPYINGVRRCGKCARWGHSTPFCRGSLRCAKCSLNHPTEMCRSEIFKCCNCGGDHQSFDPICQIFIKNKIVNAVMAYSNLSRFYAFKLIKSRNIIDLNQVENSFRSLAYKAWDLRGVDSVSIKSRAPSQLSFPYKDNFRNSYHNMKTRNPPRELNLPILSSSRYQSCMESPTHSENSKEVVHQDVSTNFDPVRKKFNRGRSFSVGTSPMSERAPSFDPGNNSKINEESRRRFLYLNDIMFITQQENKSESTRIAELREYCKNAC